MLNKLDNPAESCQLKFVDDSGWGVFTGYASTFGNVDRVGDTILKGAFKDTIANGRETKLRLNHGSIVIGKTTNLGEDDIGLSFQGELTPGHSVAKDMESSMKHGTVSEFSIGFEPPGPGDFETKSDGGRILKKISLAEISLVTLVPADPYAVVTENVKTEIESINSLKDAERMLRDVAYFSVPEAKAFVSCLKKLCLRDVDAELRDEYKALVQRVELSALLDKYSLRNILQ